MFESNTHCCISIIYWETGDIDTYDTFETIDTADPEKFEVRHTIVKDSKKMKKRKIIF